MCLKRQYGDFAFQCNTLKVRWNAKEKDSFNIFPLHEILFSEFADIFG